MDDESLLSITAEHDEKRVRRNNKSKQNDTFKSKVGYQYCLELLDYEVMPYIQ